MLSGCSPLALAFLLGPLTGSLLLPFLQGGGSDDTELRYSTQYEERLDPFSSFRGQAGPSSGGPGCGVNCLLSRVVSHPERNPDVWTALRESAETG